MADYCQLKEQRVSGSQNEKDSHLREEHVYYRESRELRDTFVFLDLDLLVVTSQCSYVLGVVLVEINFGFSSCLHDAFNC